MKADNVERGLHDNISYSLVDWLCLYVAMFVIIMYSSMISDSLEVGLYANSYIILWFSFFLIDSI